MSMKFLAKSLLEGVSLGLIIIVTQLYVFPQAGLLSPTADWAIGAAFATFVVYTGMTLIHRSKQDEKS